MIVVKISIPVNDLSIVDMIIADLYDKKYYAFQENEEQLDAFIELKDFIEDEVIEIATRYNCSFQKMEIQEQNWNKEWESNFQPVVVNNKIFIRADFHERREDMEVDIIITPKMSFGTGHHATTFLMIKAMEQMDLSGKTVLDFGTGTGVLAIYAEKKGCISIAAIDNDEWSINNAEENIKKNHCKNITLAKREQPPLEEKFDVILANINTHILLKNVENIRSVCKKNGQLLISGFISRDLKTLSDAFSVGGFRLEATDVRDGWYCLSFKN
ncbi:MAG: 50S ribosomal protein L11 methyltransferase [Ginsengibacter sp.]